MNKSWFYLGAVSSLAIVMTSCGGDGDKKAAAPAATPQAASSTPKSAPAIAPAPNSPTTNPTATATAPPLVPAKSPTVKAVSPDVAVGLIPPTDGDNWARTVPKGRLDPFGVLALQPVEAEPKDLLTQPAKSVQQAQINKQATAKPPKIATVSSKTRKAHQKAVIHTATATNSATKTPQSAAKVAPKVVRKVARNLDPIQPIKAAKAIVVTPKDSSKLPKSGINANLPKVTIAAKPLVEKPGNHSLVVAIKPLPEKPAKSQSTISIKPLPEKPAKSQPTISIKPLPAKPAKAQPTISIKPLPQPLKTAPVAPVKPEPILARSVGVSGVMEVDGKMQIIIKLPNESFSRYVEVGDRIFDGKIMVKRVEGAQTLSPTVVLEEVGVEVNRRVGEIPVTPTGNSTPTLTPAPAAQPTP